MKKSILALSLLLSLGSTFAFADTYQLGGDGQCYIVDNAGNFGYAVDPENCWNSNPAPSGTCPAGYLANPYGGACCPAGTLGVRGGCCPAGDGTCINGF